MNKRSLGTILQDLEWECAVWNLLDSVKRRTRSINLHLLQQMEVEKEVACGVPRDKAVRLVTANLFAKFLEIKIGSLETHSVEDFVKHISGNIQAGRRWQELIDACGSREILLINEVIMYDDVKTSDDWDKDIKQRGEVDSEVDSEDYQKTYLMDEDDVMQNGTDTEFQDLKRILLAPDLCLKATCKRLNGVLVMLERLGFSDRLFSHLCQDAKMDNNDERPLSTDLKEFLTSETRRRMEEVFGKFEPICITPLESHEKQDNSNERDQSSAETTFSRGTTTVEKRNCSAKETFVSRYY
jgi:hypothetical protein